MIPSNRKQGGRASSLLVGLQIWVHLWLSCSSSFYQEEKKEMLRIPRREVHFSNKIKRIFTILFNEEDDSDDDEDDSLSEQQCDVAEEKEI
ncbi:hypothetical protein LINPERHAP1_LOCUS24872 [Linum perenne]